MSPSRLNSDTGDRPMRPQGIGLYSLTGEAVTPNRKPRNPIRPRTGWNGRVARFKSRPPYNQHLFFRGSPIGACDSSTYLPPSCRCTVLKARLPVIFQIEAVESGSPGGSWRITTFDFKIWLEYSLIFCLIEAKVQMQSRYRNFQIFKLADI